MAQNFVSGVTGQEAYNAVAPYSNHAVYGGTVNDSVLAACLDDAIASGDWPNIEAVAAANLAYVQATVPGTIAWADANGAVDIARMFVFLAMGQGDQSANTGWIDDWYEAWQVFFAESGALLMADMDTSALADVEAMYAECLGDVGTEGGGEGGGEGAPAGEPTVTLGGAGEVGIDRERRYFAEVSIPDGFQDNGQLLKDTEITVTLTWATANDKVLVLNDVRRVTGAELPRTGANAVTTQTYIIIDGGPAEAVDEAANEAAATSYGVGDSEFIENFDLTEATSTVLVTASFEATDANNLNSAVVGDESSIVVTVTRWEWWEGCEAVNLFRTGFSSYASWFGCSTFWPQGYDVDVLDTEYFVGDGIPDGWQLELLAYTLCNQEGYGDVIPKADYPRDIVIAPLYQANLARIDDFLDNYSLTRDLLLTTVDELSLSPNSFAVTAGIQITVTATSGEGDTLFYWVSLDPTVAIVTVLDPLDQSTVVITGVSEGDTHIWCNAMGTPVDPKLPDEGLWSSVGVLVIALPDPNAPAAAATPCAPGSGIPGTTTGITATGGLIAELQAVVDLWEGGAQAEAGIFTDPLDFDRIDLPITGYWIDDGVGATYSDNVLGKLWGSLYGLGQMGANMGADFRATLAGLAGMTDGSRYTMMYLLSGWAGNYQETVGASLLQVTTELQAMTSSLTQQLLNLGFVSGWLIGDGVNTYPELAAFSTAVSTALATISTINRGEEGDPWTITTPGIYTPGALAATPGYDFYDWAWCCGPPWVDIGVFTAWGDYNGDGLAHGALADLVQAAGGNKTDFVNGATGQSDFWKGNPMLPVTGLVGLGLLAGAFAVSGAALIRRKRS